MCRVVWGEDRCEPGFACEGTFEIMVHSKAWGEAEW